MSAGILRQSIQNAIITILESNVDEMLMPYQ